MATNGEEALMFRWFALAILLGALTVSGIHRYRARVRAGAIGRRQETLPLIAGRLLVAVPLFGGVVAYIVSPGSMAWASLDIPGGLRWTGLAIGILAVGAVHWVLRHLGSNVSETVLTKTRQDLVTSGPYGYVRHPLYATGVVLFVSLGLVAGNWFILLFALVALLAVRLVVVPIEEQALLAKFGADYRGYRQRTGALWPRLRGGAGRT